MTAETLTASRATAAFPVAAYAGGGVLQVAYGTYAIAANVEDGDIFEMCKVPAGATIVGGWVYAADLDSNGTETLDMDIGWADNGGSGTHDDADPAGLGNLGVWVGDAFAVPSVSATVGNVIPFSGVLATGVLPSFTRETTIQIEANAAAATFAAGSVSVVVFYTLD